MNRNRVAAATELGVVRCTAQGCSGCRTRSSVSQTERPDLCLLPSALGHSCCVACAGVYVYLFVEGYEMFFDAEASERVKTEIS